MSDPTEDLVRRLLALDPEERAEAIGAMDLDQQREFAGRWRAWAQEGQHEPAGDWRVWLIRAGRGFGKTRAGAEWVRALVRTPEVQIALVGATMQDVRQVMVEGPSGVLAICAQDGGGGAARPMWNITAGEIRWPNGSIAYLHSAESPEKLRGPEHHAAWCDELAKWRRGDATWDNLMMTLRLGDLPRVLVTTTPRPTALMRRVMALPGMHETHGRTADNPHLPDSFRDAMAQTYGRSTLGLQELEGELIETVAGALWPRALIERQRGATLKIVRVVIGVDPPAGVGGDACGIVAVGLGDDAMGYVLEDASVAGATPERWARAVAACCERWDAERVVAEANNGGAMVASVLRAADARLPVTLVHASRGKVARAEPVAALYEAGRVWHRQVFAELEAEMAGMQIGGGYEGPGRSPDRADALVWALTALMLARRAEIGVRAV
jgi:phage terminase large subunit-like protein